MEIKMEFLFKLFLMLLICQKLCAVAQRELCVKLNHLDPFTCRPVTNQPVKCQDVLNLPIPSEEESDVRISPYKRYILVHEPPSEINVVYCVKYQLETTCDTNFFGVKMTYQSHFQVPLSVDECSLHTDTSIDYPEPVCEWNKIVHKQVEKVEAVKHKAFIDMKTGKILYPGFTGNCFISEKSCRSEDGKFIMKYNDKEGFPKPEYVKEIFFDFKDAEGDHSLFNIKWGAHKFKDLKVTSFLGEDHWMFPDGTLMKIEGFVPLPDTPTRSDDPLKNPFSLELSHIFDYTEQRSVIKSCKLASSMLQMLVNQNKINLDLIQFFKPIYPGHHQLILGNRSGIWSCPMVFSKMKEEECKNEFENLYKKLKIDHSPFYRIKNGKAVNFELNHKWDSNILEIGDIAHFTEDNELFDLKRRYGINEKDFHNTNHKQTVSKSYKETFLSLIPSFIKDLFESASKIKRVILIFCLLIAFGFSIWILSKIVSIIKSIRSLKEPQIKRSKSNRRPQKDNSNDEVFSDPFLI